MYFGALLPSDPFDSLKRKKKEKWRREIKEKQGERERDGEGGETKYLNLGGGVCARERVCVLTVYTLGYIAFVYRGYIRCASDE